MSPQPPAAPDRLPVLELVGEAWRLVFARLPDFAFLGAAPALALCGLGALRAIAGGQEPSAIWMLGDQLMWTFVWASLGVSWHRFVLLGTRNKATWGELPFGPNEARFFLYAFGLRAPLLLLVMLMNWGDEALAPLLFALTVLQVMLLILFPFIFPATALGQGVGLGQAWRLLRRGAVPLFAAALLASLPCLFAVMAFLPLVGRASGVVPEIIATPFAVVPALAAEGVYSVVIALAYRRLAGTGGLQAPS